MSTAGLIRRYLIVSSMSQTMLKTSSPSSSDKTAPPSPATSLPALQDPDLGDFSDRGPSNFDPDYSSSDESIPRPKARTVIVEDVPEDEPGSASAFEGAEPQWDDLPPNAARTDRHPKINGQIFDQAGEKLGPDAPPIPPPSRSKGD
ncbi:hypothetical protein EIP91_010606 [Steccherinum ochraceum]|uniref:Uncharacterized protein n=1 Tax=Steccherinum ochraceum TaxID=92696 RepID=A0A4R0R0G1_9APHY|nr:hypothetical protein EIP91_010606 [Steccherinum ochraceum]